MHVNVLASSLPDVHSCPCLPEWQAQATTDTALKMMGLTTRRRKMLARSTLLPARERPRKLFASRAMHSLLLPVKDRAAAMCKMRAAIAPGKACRPRASVGAAHPNACAHALLLRHCSLHVTSMSRQCSSTRKAASLLLVAMPMWGQLACALLPCCDTVSQA